MARGGIHVKRRTNRELEELSKGENVVNWIKGQKDKLAGWVTWREWRKIGCPKMIFTQEMEGKK
jgi:hypothetical protein